MINKPNHPAVQAVFTKIRKEHLRNLKEKVTLKELFICPSREAAIFVERSQNGCHIYKIEPRTYSVLKSWKFNHEIDKPLDRIRIMSLNKMPAQLDGTIVFMRISGEKPEFVCIDLNSAIDDIKSIYTQIREECGWCTEVSPEK